MKRHLNEQELADIILGKGLSKRPNKRSYILDCPVCEKDKLYIEKASGRGICFHCGDSFRGWADYILSVVLKEPVQELAKRLYGDNVPAGTGAIDIDLEDFWGEMNEDEIVIETEPELPELLWSPDYKPLMKHSSGALYLEGRGVPFEIAQEYGVRYSGHDQRVAFPVIIDGTLRGWQARYIRNTTSIDELGNRFEIPKMLTVGKLGGKCLMFYDRITSDYAVLNEGPFDAIKCHLAGGNVASMTKNFTYTQLDALAKKGVKRLYDALDPDAAEDTMRLIREAQGRYPFKLLKMEIPTGREDMGDATMEEALDSFRSAKPMRIGQVFFFLKERF